jgi:hypothetical protein
MTDQFGFDFEGAFAAKEKGIARVDANAGAWKDKARLAAMTLKFPEKWEGLGEDFRRLLIKGGLGIPHSPNCWGSLINWCLKKGILEPTGEVRNTRDRKSHACYTKVYRHSGAR